MLEDILLVMKQKRIEQLPSSIFPSKTTSMNIRGHMEVSLSQQAPILQSLWAGNSASGWCQLPIQFETAKLFLGTFKGLKQNVCCSGLSDSPFPCHIRQLLMVFLAVESVGTPMKFIMLSEAARPLGHDCRTLEPTPRPKQQIHTFKR